MRARTNFVAIDNDLGGDGKLLTIPDDDYLAAVGLYVLAICYCDRQRTDGLISSAAMRRAVAPGMDTAALVPHLVNAGLLHEREDGFEVNAYLEWQRSRAEIEASIEQRREAGRRSAAKRRAEAQTPGRPKTLEDKIEKTDKTDRPTDKSALTNSFNDSFNDSLDGQETAVGGWVNRITEKQLADLVQTFGKETVTAAAEQLEAEEIAGTVQVRNFAALLAHRLKHPKPIPSAPDAYTAADYREGTF